MELRNVRHAGNHRRKNGQTECAEGRHRCSSEEEARREKKGKEEEGRRLPGIKRALSDETRRRKSLNEVSAAAKKAAAKAS